MAHIRIREAFQRLSGYTTQYGGVAREIRGDALVAEFDRGSDVICAALAFQAANRAYNQELEDDIRPGVRTGIALGEVGMDDHTVTGAGVVGVRTRICEILRAVHEVTR